MSCIKDTYMEYSIMTTNRCNLQCSYCINSDRRKKNPAKIPEASKVINHILRDASKHGYDPVIITFYGGEPMMEQGFLKEVMEGTRALSPMFNMFTNGTLISASNLPLLEKMNMVSISIDGDSEMHDRVRGKGSFQKILDNYLAVKEKIISRTVAFITVTPKTSIYRSVMGLSGQFSNIFWFLEHSEGMDGTGEFLDGYDKDLDRLFEYWMENMRMGKAINLIPFQGLYDIIEHKHVYSGLPCGIGDNFQALAIDGSVYSCEDSYHNKIGDIEAGVDMGKARQNYDFKICEGCEARPVCAGRCVIPHMNYSREKVEFYCRCSKMLIEKFKRVLPEVKTLVAAGKIREEDILNRLTRFTDVMP